MKSKSQTIDDFLESWIEFNVKAGKMNINKELKTDLFKIYMDLDQKWINVRHFEGE